MLQHVSKSYTGGASCVLEDISLSVPRGEFLCILGMSGCGKTTLIKLMAGIETPTRGTVIKPERIGMVFQSYALLPWLTVEDNVAFAPRMQGADENRVAELTVHYLRMVHLESFAKKYPRELSGGQRQRVGLARALAIEPEVLLMDEPFSALDPVITDELHEDLLEIWQKTRTTIIMVSHHLEEAVLLADKVGIIRSGRLEHLVPIGLPRPRKETGAGFMEEVHRLKGYLSG